MRVLTDSARQQLRPVDISPNDRCHVALDNDGTRFICKFTSTVDTIYGGVSGRCHSFIAGVPEHRRITVGSGLSYIFAGTDTTALMMRSTWPDDQIEFDDDARLLFDYLLMRYEAQNRVIEIAQDFRAHGEAPAQSGSSTMRRFRCRSIRRRRR